MRLVNEKETITDTEKLLKYHTVIVFVIGVFFALIQDAEYVIESVVILVSVCALCGFMFLTRRVISADIRVHIISNGSFLFAFGISMYMGTIPYVFTLYLCTFIVAAMYFKKSVIIVMAVIANITLIVCVLVLSIEVPGEFNRLWFFNNMTGLNLGILLLYIISVTGKSFIDKIVLANRAKSDYLATMSHEIRTPLNAILGVTQIQAQKTDIPAEYASAFEKISDSGNTLLKIINDILDLSKIETGKMELYPVEYDIPSLINDTVQLNILRIGDKPVNFILEVDESLPSALFGDELRLKQILNNLLSNAIKYTDKGHVKLTVTHTEDNDGVTLCFTVEDTGQGMTKEDCDKLFSDEYMRFNAEINRGTEGTGLGLSITKKFVELMGGEITVKSEYGAGSTFTAKVKQKKTAVNTGIGAQTAANLRDMTYRNNATRERRKAVRCPIPYGKVLVVDDIESNLLVSKGLLKPYGLDIETVNSGQKAIDKIQNGAVYDIIFMDHMMPEPDGIETTKILRNGGYGGTIIALTANALAGNEEMFRQNGFDGFISKPIDIRLLDKTLNTFIRDKYPEQAEKYRTKSIEQDYSEKVSRDMARVFRKSAYDAIKTLRETTANGDIKLFTITAHGMKSALANIWEQEASDAAYRLEKAGQSGDTEYIKGKTEDFITELEQIADKLSADTDESSPAGDTSLLAEQLKAVIAACEAYDDTAALAALDELTEKKWSDKQAETLGQIRDAIYLDSNFEQAAELARKLL